jgi:hypothetical protein
MGISEYKLTVNSSNMRSLPVRTAWFRTIKEYHW